MNKAGRLLLRAIEFADAHENRPLLLVVQRGLSLVLPLILVGSLGLMFQNAPFGLGELLESTLGPSWSTLWDTLVSGTFGIAALALLCAFTGSMAMLHNQQRIGPFVSPSLAIVVVMSCAFVLIAPREPAEWENIFYINRSFLLSLAVSIAGSTLFLRLSRLRALQLPMTTVGHDPVVRDVLTVMPAGIAAIFIFGVARILLNFIGIPDVDEAVRALLLAPFAQASDTLGFGLAYTGITQLLWLVGMHGPHMLSGVEEHILVPAAQANIAAWHDGAAPVFIFTKPFFDAFTRMGGSGSTLCLIIAIFLGSRDTGSRKLCRFALLPALCNVNEPLLFGIPLVFNPVYCIPFLCAPLLQTVTAYLATVLELVPRTAGEAFWTTPALVSGYAATHSLAGVAMQVVNLAVGVSMYLPFVRLADTMQERRGKRVLSALQQAAACCHIGPGGRKCLDLPGEAGRLAKALANDLAATLDRHDQLFLVYQPQLHGTLHRITGVEALIRWRHPVYGFIAPPVIIALAEDAGFIDKLGLQVLADACALRAAWVDRVPDDLRISVNVSPRQLLHPHFPENVLAVLTDAGLASHLLELEITESSVLEPNPHILEALKTLQGQGVRVAIDDFGMGHASLRYLRAFPVDTIKIDRSLTLDYGASVNEHIVRSIVELGQAMGISTVVEGVEQHTQLERFLALGCSIFQGYLFSRPLPGEECLHYIRTQPSRD
ncbi:EAL domain-containing protein [Megalodesulfovibrio gigas]|nr:EAL domain-containing protein [Megalodesulfovibrio gigas]